MTRERRLTAKTVCVSRARASGVVLASCYVQSRPVKWLQAAVEGRRLAARESPSVRSCFVCLPHILEHISAS